MEPPSIASQIEQYTGKPENELSPLRKIVFRRITRMF